VYSHTQTHSTWVCTDVHNDTVSNCATVQNAHGMSPLLCSTLLGFGQCYAITVWVLDLVVKTEGGQIRYLTFVSWLNQKLKSCITHYGIGYGASYCQHSRVL
jgi:hypothetical protein